MFVIRIELHNTTNYEPLHTAMARRGMFRTINAQDGKLYTLPTGTYYTAEAGTPSSILQEAQAAAREARHFDAMVLVVEATKCTWSGLQIAYRKGA